MFLAYRTCRSRTGRGWQCSIFAHALLPAGLFYAVIRSKRETTVVWTGLLLLFFSSICSCTIDGHVVMRADDVLAAASGKTEIQIKSGIENEKASYRKSIAKNDYTAAIAHLKALNAQYEKLFYMEMDSSGAWRSPALFTPRKANKADKKAYRNNLAEGYLSNQHKLAKYSLAVVDTNSYYHWLMKILQPEPKLKSVTANIDQSVRAKEFYETWLFTIKASRVYHADGRTEAAINLLETLSGVLRIADDAFRRIDTTADLTWKDMLGITSCLLSNYYLLISDIPRSSELLKSALGNTEKRRLKIRIFLLLSEVKRRSAETRLASYYLQQALSIAHRNNIEFLDNVLLSGLSPALIEHVRPQPKNLIETADRFIQSANLGNRYDFPGALLLSRDPFLNAAYIYREMGLDTKSKWCLRRFQTRHKYGYDEIEDTCDYARFLVRNRSWHQIQAVFLPRVDLFEYYRLRTLNSRYSARSLKNLSAVYSALALSLLRTGNILAVDKKGHPVWPSSLGQPSLKADVLAYKLTQLAKSRELYATNNSGRSKTKSTGGVRSQYVVLCDQVAGKNADTNVKSILKSDFAEWKRSGAEASVRTPMRYFEEDTIQLNQKTGVFDLLVAENEIIYFFLNEKKLRSSILNVKYNELSYLAKEYYDLCRSPGSSGYEAIAKQIVLYLFSDVMPYLKRLRILYFAPDRSLTILPLDAAMKMSGISNLKALKVINTPSTYLLAKALKKERPESGRFAALLGDPMPLDIKKIITQTSIMDKQLITSLRGLTLKSKKNALFEIQHPSDSYDFSFVFKRIPYTAEEIKTLETQFNDAGIETDVLLKEQLTKPNVRSLLHSRPYFLHFATHAIISNDIPYMVEPALVLSGSGRVINHFLLSREIEKFDLHETTLVVLSACKSGVDLYYDSEGISGLAKSFMIAGARNVVLTLWSIDDKATSVFMVHFYEAILKGESIHSALYHAKAKMIRTTAYSHPVYWAGFVLYGEG